MYRKILKIKKTEDLNIQLPKEYLNKEVEITAYEIKNDTSENEVNDFSDAEAFYNKFNVKMSDFKFNRDEANER